MKVSKRLAKIDNVNDKMLWLESFIFFLEKVNCLGLKEKLKQIRNNFEEIKKWNCPMESMAMQFLISQIDKLEIPDHLFQIGEKFYRQQRKLINPKRKNIKTALTELNWMENIVAKSRNPILTSLKIAVAGNGIGQGEFTDPGLELMGKISEILATPAKNIFDFDYKALIKQLKGGNQKILYCLPDLKGIVTDLVLIKRLLLRGNKVTIAGRSKEVENFFNKSKVKKYLGNLALNLELIVNDSSQFLKIWEQSTIRILKGSWHLNINDHHFFRL